MFESLFDYPLYVAGPVMIAFLWLFAFGGLYFVRRKVLPHLNIAVADSEFTGSMAQSVMVFYGLAVALIAVNVFQDYDATSNVLSAEATHLAALYRDVSGYPDHIRPELQSVLREYTDQIINEAWPLQHQGIVPTKGIELMNRFQAELVRFEPATEGQKLLHAEALRGYNAMLINRRMRLDSVGTGLPAVMWIVILVGALISMTGCFFFKVKDVRLHLVMVVLLATFIGLVIFMILALDRPFRGDLGLGPGPYQLVYDQLMKP